MAFGGRNFGRHAQVLIREFVFLRPGYSETELSRLGKHTATGSIKLLGRFEFHSRQTMLFCRLCGLTASQVTCSVPDPGLRFETSPRTSIFLRRCN